MKTLIIFLAILLLVLSCGKNPTSPTYQKEIAVFGFLWGNKPLSEDRSIMITYTQPIDKYFDFQNAAITNANVTITELNSGTRYKLKSSAKPGYYFNDSLLVKIKTTYRLEVDIDGKIVTATTTVPLALEIQTELSLNTVDSVYHANLSKEKPIFVVCDSQEQIIGIELYCNESWENAEYVSPFWGQKKPNDEEEYGGQDGNSEPRRIIAAMKFKDLISLTYPGRYIIDWYSSMIGFFGSYTMLVAAIDENYYNFINKNEYPELQSGIQGGVGVFGSLCGEIYRLYILKP